MLHRLLLPTIVFGTVASAMPSSKSFGNRIHWSAKGAETDGGDGESESVSRFFKRDLASRAEVAEEPANRSPLNDAKSRTAISSQEEYDALIKVVREKLLRYAQTGYQNEAKLGWKGPKGASPQLCYFSPVQCLF